MDTSNNDDFQDELFCDCSKKFNIISLYCSNMIEKKLPIKSTVNFFRDDANSSHIKDLAGKRSIIRKEFLDLIKKFAKYVSAHLLSISGEHYLCKDKNIEDVYVEIAKSIHTYIFHGKKILVKIAEVSSGNSEEDPLPVIIPSAESIYKELKYQLKKSIWNKKNYLQGKRSVKQESKQHHNSDEDSGDDDDEERGSSL